MSGSLVLAIDQGTSSTKALLVDSRGEIVGRAQTPVSLATPEPGWVQQDGEEIWTSVRRAASEAIAADAAKLVVSVGLSTQRESCIIWDRRTGEALTPVLSWQDQRTEGICAACRRRDTAHDPPQERPAARSRCSPPPRRAGCLTDSHRSRPREIWPDLYRDN